MKKDEVVTLLHSMKRRLNDISDDIFDDGCDQHDKDQNIRYTYEMTKIHDISHELSMIDVDELSVDELDDMWRDSWEGYVGTHLPEAQLGHATRYIDKLLNVL